MFKKKLGKWVSIMLAATMTSTGSIAVFGEELLVKSQKIEMPKEEQLQRKLVGYFPEWAYKSDVQGYYVVTDLQWDDLTHIQYSFAGIDPATNKIQLGDRAAAIEEEFTGRELLYKGQEVKLDASLPYKGHFNLLQVMKKQKPDVKVLISVGGWAGSRGFYTMLDTDQGIDTFADSCVSFIREYGFDGVDIDFEYPSATDTSGNPDDQDLAKPRRAKLNERYNLMMKTLREKLDKAAEEDGKYYSLTAALTASAWVLGGMSSGDYAQYLDFISVMSYDFHGGWNGYVENLANIYPDPNDTETKGQVMPYLSMDWAYRYYSGVVPPEKILMGIPYYTRGWEKVRKQSGAETGLHGTSIKTIITETGNGATGECNIWGDDDDHDNKIDGGGSNPLWYVKNLMADNPNYKQYWDDNGKVPYIWNEERATFLSFEDERSIGERAKYIQDKNLGGALVWVMNGDYGANPNYVPGSKNVNEGKYTYGDTLTHLLKSELDKMGSCNKTDNPWDTLETTNVEVTFKNVYDHPNGTYTISVKNKTNESIPGGWKVGFNLPKSCKFQKPWGSTATETDNGVFSKIEITSAAWNAIAPGQTVNIQGMVKLSFSDVAHMTFNGLKPINFAKDSDNPSDLNPLKADIKTQTPVTQKDTYDITVAIPAQSKATSYVLYENEQVIKQGQVDPVATQITSFTENIKGKIVGKYKYKVELKNDKGSSLSSILTVDVIEGQVEKLQTASVSTNLTTTETGIYDVTVSIPKESNAIAYTLFENGKAIKTGSVDPKVTAVTTVVEHMKDKAVGKYEYQVELRNDKEVTVSQAARVEVIKSNQSKPGAPSVAHDNWDNDGNYTITFNMWWGVNGNEWKLYENDIEIYKGTLTPNGSQAQSGHYKLTNKGSGQYNYRVELINSGGVTSSNKITVTVKGDVEEEQPEKLQTASVNVNQIKTETGIYDVTVTIPKESHATAYSLLENGIVIKKDKLDPKATAVTTFVEAMKDKAIGKYEYQVELKNDKEVTNSQTATVEVLKKGESKPPVSPAPAAPTVAHDNWNNNTNYTITFNMWWGVNGDEWKLYENNVEIYKGMLTANGSEAQSGHYKVTNKGSGQYDYRVELINSGGVTNSNKITVTVKGNEAVQQEPIVEEPIVEEPKIEEPKIEEPKIEEPIVEEPIV